MGLTYVSIDPCKGSETVLCRHMASHASKIHLICLRLLIAQHLKYLIVIPMKTYEHTKAHTHNSAFHIQSILTAWEHVQCNKLNNGWVMQMFLSLGGSRKSKEKCWMTQLCQINGFREKCSTTQPGYYEQFCVNMFVIFFFQQKTWLSVDSTMRCGKKVLKLSQNNQNNSGSESGYLSWT